jgi:hypothetical protein
MTMATVNYGFSIQVSGGPQIVASQAATIEAYDKIDVVVDPGAADLVVEIQPGAATQVRLLAISSTLYGSEISYKVADGGGDKGPYTLDAPQFFSGGAVGVFGVPPRTLKFSNAHSAGDPAKKAAVQIFVCRDATP